MRIGDWNETATYRSVQEAASGHTAPTRENLPACPIAPLGLRPAQLMAEGKPNGMAGLGRRDRLSLGAFWPCSVNRARGPRP